MHVTRNAASSNMYSSGSHKFEKQLPLGLNGSWGSSMGVVGAIIADGALGPAQSVVDDTGHLEVADESL